MRYLIADPAKKNGWRQELTGPDGMKVERMVRFVFDRKKVNFIHIDIEDRAASKAEIAEVYDELTGSFTTPESLGLHVSSETPDWCSSKIRAYADR